MLSFQLNRFTPRRKSSIEPTKVSNEHQNYTIANQDDVKRKLNILCNKKILLSIKVPGKYATSTLLTTISHLENKHIYLGGFQNDRFNKELLLQNDLTVTANFEGIAVSFILSEFNGHILEDAFNIKAPLPHSLEWVQRRNARRVKIPLNVPVKIKYKHYAECFDVADISVAGLSYIDQVEEPIAANVGGLYPDCNIILPDKSVHLACCEIVNNVTIHYQHTKLLKRVGCEIKRPSYQLDTALQYLINQIDFQYQ